MGGFFLINDTTTEITTVVRILCQTKINGASTTKPANPINQNGTLVCGANTLEVVR